MFFRRQTSELLERLRKGHLVGGTISHRDEQGVWTEMTWVDGRFCTQEELVALDREDRQTAEPAWNAAER